MEIGKGTVWRAAAAGASALLMWGAFAPRGEAMDVFFALAPMLLVSRLSAPRAAARWWFLSGLAFWFATLSWMPAIVKNGGPWPLVVLGWGALAAYCAAFHAAFGWFAASARAACAGRRGARFLLLFAVEPVAWAFFEWLRAHLFGGFAWNFLGTAAAGVPLLAAPASLGGAYLVSALVVLANGVVATVVERAAGPMLGRPAASRAPRARLVRALETGVPLLLILLAVSAAGRLRVPSAGPLQVRVALVQRNFPCVFSDGPREDPFEVYARLLSTAALAKPDLAVFSESAMCEFGGARTARAAEAVARLRADSGLAGAVLAGADDREETPEGTRVYNAAALYPAEGPVEVYRKQHLVPFGEFIPLDKVFPVLQKLAPIGSLHPGEPKLLSLAVPFGAAGELSGAVRIVPFAPLICFEDTDPDLARDAARRGARFFAFITNDSWFSDSAEALQHFRQSILRCVETGLFAVRTGNSGVTAVICPSGRYAALTDAEGRPLVDAAGSMTHVLNLPETPSATVYARLGDIPLLVLSALLAGTFLCARLKRR